MAKPITCLHERTQAGEIHLFFCQCQIRLFIGRRVRKIQCVSRCGLKVELLRVNLNINSQEAHLLLLLIDSLVAFYGRQNHLAPCEILRLSLLARVVFMGIQNEKLITSLVFAYLKLFVIGADDDGRFSRTQAAETLKMKLYGPGRPLSARAGQQCGQLFLL